MDISGLSISSKPIKAGVSKSSNVNSSLNTRLNYGNSALKQEHRKKCRNVTLDNNASHNNKSDMIAPNRVLRPKEWNNQVEEAFRFQETGWKDVNEYKSAYGDPERWPNGFVKCTRVKRNGYYTYWRNVRECHDKYINRVKLYEY